MTPLVLLALTLGVPPGDPEISALLESASLAPLRASTTVQAARVDNYLPPRDKVPVDAESLQLPGVFRVRKSPITLRSADAAKLRAVLKRPSSYSSLVSACMFEPGVAFTFPVRDDLMLLICFKCREVAFVKGTQVLSKLSLSNGGRQGLWEASTKVFPELRKDPRPAVER